MKWVRYAVVAIFLVLAAGAVHVGVCAASSRRSVALPEVNGRSVVGRYEIDWVDATRVDPFAPGRQPRRLAVWVWYPARPTRSASAGYAPGAWDQMHFPGILGLGETSFRKIRTRSVTGAPPARGHHALVVLAPGLGLPILQYQSLGRPDTAREPGGTDRRACPGVAEQPPPAEPGGRGLVVVGGLGHYRVTAAVSLESGSDRALTAMESSRTSRLVSLV